MLKSQTFRGFATVSYYAPDLEAAKNWYAELLGIQPYFVREGYIEFRVGDYEHELGIIDSKYIPKVAKPGTLMKLFLFWIPRVRKNAATSSTLLTAGILRCIW